MVDQQVGPRKRADRRDPVWGHPAGPGAGEFNDLITPARGIEQPTSTRRDALVREPRHGRQRRRGLRMAWLAVPLVLLVLLGSVAGGVYLAFPDQVKSLFAGPDDYTGSGSGHADIVIHEGDIGSVVATTLAQAGVVKTEKAFYDLLVATKPQPTFQPGTYRVALHMSAASALRALQDPANAVIGTVAIPEGSTVAQIVAIAAKKTGVPLADLQAVVKDFHSLKGVPAAAPRLEGFLFPATYQFQPGTSARVILQTMVDRMTQALDADGVPAADRLKVLTLAGLVQKEGNGPDDKKVARVFLNRIKTGMRLQSDATVSYGAGGTTVVPTTKQYAAKNGYNTYIRSGLPVGPISNPGDVAITAALHPASGPWLFFVTVNLATGETVFSTTLAEHDKASARFQAWLKAHPSYGK